VSKAEGDYDNVLLLRRSRKRSRYDNICYHCQQCAEKYMKARLNEARIQFRKTHDLEALLDLVKAIEPHWTIHKPRLKRLTEFAFTVRYPGASANRADAADAFVTCTEIRSLAEPVLVLNNE